MIPAVVSVVIPVYNGESFVLDTLLSVINQTYSYLEVLVVDDGSTDRTASIVKSIVDPRIVYSYQSNSGVSRARNSGLLQAHGDFLVFLDADDVLQGKFIEDRIKYFSSCQADCVTGPVYLFGETIVKSPSLRGCSCNGLHEILLSNPSVTTAPSAYFFRLDFLKQHFLFFNETLSSTADREFLIRCLAVGTFAFCANIAPLYYRVALGSMSRLKTPKLLLDLKLFYENISYLTSNLNLQDSSVVSTAKSIIALDIASVSLSLGRRNDSFHYTVMALKLSPAYCIAQLTKIFFGKLLIPFSCLLFTLLS
jgi:glycosyltransferase involved in cell wall biosynthesis